MVVAGNELDESGLACAVIPQQADDFVRADLEIHVTQRGHLTECLGYVLHLEQVVHLSLLGGYKLNVEGQRFKVEGLRSGAANVQP